MPDQILAPHPLEAALAARGSDPAPVPLDGMLARTIDEAEAQARVRRWVRRSWLAPTKFRRARIGSAEAIHVPCYAFNAETESQYNGTTQVTRSSKNKSYSTSSTRTEKKSGRLATDFRDLTVCSVPTLDVPNLHRLEPWPTEHLLAPDPAAPEVRAAPAPALGLGEAAQKGRSRLAAQIRAKVYDEMGGKGQSINKLDTTTTGESFRHLLLPVLVVPVSYGVGTQFVLVNGVTGKVGGRRPTNFTRKRWAWLAGFWLFFVAVGALVWPNDCNPRCAESRTGAPESPASVSVPARGELAEVLR